LAIVLSIIGLLAYFFLPGMLQNREDAKYSTALSQLSKEFPSAIIRQVARTNQCSATTITKALLQDRGLPALTVWNTAWSITSVTTNTVTVNYTLDATDAKAAADMAVALTGSNNVASATANGTASITVAYRCN
jgi:type II secretory pathway pseudopilin PulG